MPCDGGLTFRTARLAVTALNADVIAMRDVGSAFLKQPVGVVEWLATVRREHRRDDRQL
jgi:hypothetical protein